MYICKQGGNLLRLGLGLHLYGICLGLPSQRLGLSFGLGLEHDPVPLGLSDLLKPVLLSLGWFSHLCQVEM